MNRQNSQELTLNPSEGEKSSETAPKKHFRKADSQKDEFQEQVLEVRRITRVVKGGRRLRFRAAVVVGNKAGRVGFGIAKASEVQKAIQKASLQARKKIFSVPISEKTHSIPHQVERKFASTKVLLKPADTGTSLIAGSSVRAILSAAGYQNVVSKTFGSTNKINSASATIMCLKSLNGKKSM